MRTTIFLLKGHHPALRDSWAQTSAAFLESSPEIPGIHESIMVKPGSLHLTLGVLSLATVNSAGRSHDHVVSETMSSSSTMFEGMLEIGNSIP